MKKLTIMISAACLLSLFSLSSQAETMKTRIGKLQFTSGYPTEKTVQKLYDELDFQRAVQAYLWALPISRAWPVTSMKTHPAPRTWPCWAYWKPWASPMGVLSSRISGCGRS